MRSQESSQETKEKGEKIMTDQGVENECPIPKPSTTLEARPNQEWWPDQLNLRHLDKHEATRTPLGDDFDYPEAIKSLDIEGLRRDIFEVMATSQDWWPADYGHYGPLFIRMAWHSAGTYRTFDGRGGGSRGTQRFAPLNSWPDNVNLDKARRLLWPIKKKYGRTISWADLIIFAGNCALEAMGVKTVGFGFGRLDIWGPEDDTYWGPEETWLGDERYSGDRELQNPLGAVQMGLIYVNPEGPNGDPDPLAAAKDIRETFSRMAMNDEETVALIAGGHTFGKTHGAVPNAQTYVGPEPEGASIEEQGLGWKNSFGKGNADDTMSSGLEGAWTNNPTKWDNGFFVNLFKYDWELTTSPAGAKQWTPSDPSAKGDVPDAHDVTKRHAPMMLTTDLALKLDPIYGPISRGFLENPYELEIAFAKAWYKLVHRDMGPISRYLGPLVPSEREIWQDPIPKGDYELIEGSDIDELKQRILDSSLTISELVSTAWASAVTFRGTDRRGGANGARIALEPQKNWEVNEPDKLADRLQVLKEIQESFNKDQTSNRAISLADLIVLGGCAAIEKAAKKAGIDISLAFTPGRGDATQNDTDVDSFSVLEPTFDGFRNYYQSNHKLAPEYLLVERSDLLTLTSKEMTLLIGGLRVLGANYASSSLGVFTKNPEALTNDFFINLLDMNIDWKRSSSSENVFVGHDRTTGEVTWTATPVDLIFGSNAQLRAIAEVYASEDGIEKFVADFAKAWVKVMNLDRFGKA